MSLALIFASMAALSGPLAQDPPATNVPELEVAPPPAATDDRDPERMICRTESVVGTNRRRRVCMTARERDERRESSSSARDRLERNLDPNAGNPASSSPSPFLGG
ncbi:hypothetical protein [Brevundimonas sp.]|uniref:hypothetical protein n=1 Tax=Brevundimonas sp. TaxID=1871086 RepID=UPI002ABAB9ED|nr:hypothetical protein [Brevundimonas sp.]MDZ4365122.1 hypothetical protein [Brevundimonas sp.]